MTLSPVPSVSLPRERVPLPEGLTRLSDGALRVDGVDGTAVINPADGGEPGGVSVETGLRVLQDAHQLGGDQGDVEPTGGRPGGQLCDTRALGHAWL